VTKSPRGSDQQGVKAKGEVHAKAGGMAEPITMATFNPYYLKAGSKSAPQPFWIAYTHR
jgi:hypothetical protein